MQLRLLVLVLGASAAAASRVQELGPEVEEVANKLLKPVEDNKIISTYLRTAKTVLTEPQAQQAEGGGEVGRLLMQLLFGIIYYFVVVSKYPAYPEGLTSENMPEEAKELQNENEVMSILKVSCSNNFLSFCCTGPRAAHTFHTTDVLNYWVGLLAMTCFPCCTLMWTNAVTDLNEKLGGEKRNILMSCLCACCCACCVVAQDAEALDIVTGSHTGLVGVTERNKA